jgi:hypothetical protein
MLSTTLAWLMEDIPGLEIHGYSVGRRQSWSLSDFLDAKNASKSSSYFGPDFSESDLFDLDE